MEVLHRIFSKPFEVTQFWASDRYRVMQMQTKNTIGYLFKFYPDHMRKYQPEQNGD